MSSSVVGKMLIAPLVAIAFASAQTQVDLQHQARGIDFTAASYTKPLRTGSALPASCGVGEAFLLTSAPAGANVYTCLQANQWTAQALTSTSALNYLAPPSGSVSRTLTSKLSDVVSVLDFGADPTGAISATAAFTAAVAAAGNNSTILIPPGNYTLATKWTIQTNNVSIDGAGAIITCAVAADDCILIGNPANVQTYANITIKGLTLVPGVQSTGAAIEAGGFHTTLDHINLTTSSGGSYTGNYWAYGIQVDNDQGFVLKNSPINAQVLECNATFCGSLLYNPPTAGYTAVGWISDSYLDPEYSGNGVDWQGTNEVHLTRVVIQAFSQFGLREVNSSVVATSTHFESGTCNNPAGNVGQAGYILVVGKLQASGDNIGNIGGCQPTLVVTNPGTAQYAYYIQPQNSAGNWGDPLPLSLVTNGPATISGSNTIALAWPTVLGAANYNIYRVNQATYGNIIPTMTGAWLVATQAQSGSNTNVWNTQTFTDTVPDTSLASVTPGSGWYPELYFWPGGVIVSASNNNPFFQAQYWGPAGPNGNFVAASYHVQEPSFNFMPGTEYGYTGFTGISSAYKSTGNNLWASYQPAPALLLPLAAEGQNFANPLQGVLNMGQLAGGGGATDLITVYNSQPAVTFGQQNNRPPAAAGDSALSQDGTTLLALRSPGSISEYINSLPNGTSWLTRLTSSQFTSTVPITAPQFCVGTFCAGNGGTLLVGKSGLTAQSASQSGVTLVSSAPQTGMYQVAYNAKVTRAAGSSSILGGTSGFVLSYTDGTDGRSQTATVAGFNESGSLITVATGNASNATTTLYQGSAQIYAESGTSISYSFGYTSVGSQTMQYALRVTAVLIN